MCRWLSLAPESPSQTCLYPAASDSQSHSLSVKEERDVSTSTCMSNHVDPPLGLWLHLSFVMTGRRVHLFLVDVFDLRDGATQDSFLFLFGQLVCHHLNGLDPLIPGYRGNKSAISCDRVIYWPLRLTILIIVKTAKCWCMLNVIQSYRSSGVSTWNVRSITVVHCRHLMMKVLGFGLSVFISWHSDEWEEERCVFMWSNDVISSNHRARHVDDNSTWCSN